MHCICFSGRQSSSWKLYFWPLHLKYELWKASNLDAQTQGIKSTDRLVGKNSPLAKVVDPWPPNCRPGPLDLRNLGDSLQVWWFCPAHFCGIWPHLVASLVNLGSESCGKMLFGYFMLPLGGRTNYYWVHMSRARNRLIKKKTNQKPNSNEAESVWKAARPFHTQ